MVVAFFFLPFDEVALAVFFTLVVLVSPAKTTMPLSSERPSIKLMIFFIDSYDLLGLVRPEGHADNPSCQTRMKTA